MPDPDGIGAFDGVWHCHQCRGWIRDPGDVDQHRRRCGPRWRQRKPEFAKDMATLAASFGEPPIRGGGYAHAGRKRRRAGAHRST